MCGYCGFFVILLIAMLVAAAMGGVVGCVANSRALGCWIAAALGVFLNVGIAAGLYYYSTHLAGGPPEPQLHLRQFVSFSVIVLIIGGAGSFLICRMTL